jgi:hypothetical protein
MRGSHLATGDSSVVGREGDREGDKQTPHQWLAAGASPREPRRRRAVHTCPSIAGRARVAYLSSYNGKLPRGVPFAVTA